MRRRHLFEWEDQPWLPMVLRDFVTDHLRFILTHGLREPVNRAIAERLKPLLARAPEPRIIDLCAGAGGPLPAIRPMLDRHLGAPVEVVLTDLYPNVEALAQREAEGGGAVRARYESTSAFDVPPGLRGLRTLFTALHHFNPTDVRRLLADAAHKRQPIAVFEPLERTPRMLFLTTLSAALQSFAWTHRVGRLGFWRFLVTYVVPVAPAVIVWDALVSVLRTYTPDELRELADGVGAPDYTWEAGRFDVRGPLGVRMPTVYLVGTPTELPS